MHLSSMRFLPWGEIVSGALTLARGGGAPGAPSIDSGGGVSVTTSVQTAVSPQISPVFIQQEKPSDSPVTAATVQMSPSPQSAGMPTAAGSSAPGTPVTGAIPGMDSAAGYLPTGLPFFPAKLSSLNPAVALAGVGIVGLAFFLSRGKRKGKGRR